MHISRVEEREDFRQTSYVRYAAAKTVSGRGIKGYLEAVDFILEDARQK